MQEASPIEQRRAVSRDGSRAIKCNGVRFSCEFKLPIDVVFLFEGFKLGYIKRTRRQKDVSVFKSTELQA